MDISQKNVLKRKRHPIAMDVNLKKEYVSLFRENTESIDQAMKVLKTRFNEKVRRRKGLKRICSEERRPFQLYEMTAKVLCPIKIPAIFASLNFLTESVQFQKMMKFLELLPQYGGDKGYITLVSILETNHFWLGEELKAELKAEKEELEMEDYILELADYMIKKQFGKSLRLSSVDKKALTYLLSKRIQYAKEVCKGRLETRQRHLQELRDLGDVLEGEILLLINKIRAFIHLNKPDLAQAYIAKQAQLAGKTDDDNVDDETGENKKTDLEVSVEELLEMMEFSVNKKYDLQKERNDSLLILKSSNPNEKLDSELARILKELEDELAAKLRQAQLEDEKIRKIKEEIAAVFAAMEKEKRKREKEMAELTDYLTKANNMLRLIQDDIEQLRRELMYCRQRADQYKVRFAKLEKTRRIGYVNEEAPSRATLMEIMRDKQRAKNPIIKPRIIKVQAAQNVSSNNNNVKPR